MSVPPAPFDRRALRLRRDRAAAGFDAYDFLFRESAERLVERLEDMTRAFPVAVDLGAKTGLLRPLLAGRFGISYLLEIEPSARMAARCAGPVVRAEEELPPLRDGSVDLILSNLALHWANDLPGALIQARRALRPDGLLLGCLLGGSTLAELRACLLEAEVAVCGGAEPRVSPTAELGDVAGLMRRAGFALPVVDADRIPVSYPDAFALMRDLRGMGETNVLAGRRRGSSRRALFAHAAALMQQRFAGADGRISVTFELLNLHGWAPCASQPQPLAPGSGQVSLAAVVGDS